MKKKNSIVLTCEHGGNNIPANLKLRFAGQKKLLSSHRGWDEYALNIAKQLKTKLGCPLFYSEISRLAVDNNRSTTNPKVFSSFTKGLAPKEKVALIKEHHTPLRTKTKSSIRANLPVHHYSIHSFVPVLFGVTRKNDIGILFDANRPAELRLASTLRRHLKSRLPNTKIYFNLPYRGGSDGHATQLRGAFKKTEYLGIEIEFNQAWVAKQTARSLKQAISLFAEAMKATALEIST